MMAKKTKTQNFLFIFFIIFSTKLLSQTFTLIPAYVSKYNYTYLNDSLNVAVFGGNNHYMTTDAGVSWNQISSFGTEIQGVEAYNITMNNLSTMCLVGFDYDDNNYIIAKTTDGGTTWVKTLIIPNYAGKLTDIYSKNNIVIASAKNGIYRSNDFGTSWVFVPIVSGQTSNFILYNKASNTWFVGGYTSNFHSSTDDGITWNELNNGVSISNITSTNCGLNNQFLISKNNYFETQIFSIDSQNNFDTVVNVQHELLTGGGHCKNSSFLPNGKLMTHNNSGVFAIDTSTEYVYQVNSANAIFVGTNKPKKITIGSNYGLAISTSSNTNINSVYLITNLNNSNISVPSIFNIASPIPCDGDVIHATAVANYADSIKWFVNNNFITSSLNLNYPTVNGVFINYEIKLITYFNGITNTTIKNVTMYAPSPTHQFTYSVDTSACYGVPLSVLIDPNPGVPLNTGLKILLNGNLIYGPVSMTTATINALTSPITTSGLLQIVTFKTTGCDNNSDTISLNITVGVNLFNYTMLSHDSVICTNVGIPINLIGTDTNNQYDFHTTYSYSPESNHFISSGNPNDTLTYNAGLFLNTIDLSFDTESYGPIFMYVNLEIEDTIGCSVSKIIDTIRIQRRTAHFDLHSRSFLRNDTLLLSNAFVTENRLWTSPSLSDEFIHDSTNITPLIIADTIGFFNIELTNSPIADCISSTFKTIHYADQAIEIEPACDIKKIQDTSFYFEKIITSKFDSFGNLYLVNGFILNNSTNPFYSFKKLDGYGNLIWERHSITQSNYNQNSMLIEDIDFDVSGNPVLAFWINVDINYSDSLVDIITPIFAQTRESYVIKLDKTSGSVIWRTKINDIYKITDVVVDGEFIHATTTDGYAINFYTYKSENGSLINQSVFVADNGFLQGTMSINNSSFNTIHASMYSPQLEVLSTGEVVAIGYYYRTIIPSYPQLDLVTPYGMFIMKYSPSLGVYDVQRLAQMGNELYYYYGGTLNKEKPKFFIDKNDNIVVSAIWDDYHHKRLDYIGNTFLLFDSLITIEDGTFIMSFKKDYTINWITLGTHSEVLDLKYSENIDQIQLLCKSKDNFSIGKDSIHKMIGEYSELDITYYNLPSSLDNIALNFFQTDVFITKLDLNGNPIEMKKIDSTSNFGQNLISFNSYSIASTTCGDLAFLIAGRFFLNYLDTVVLNLFYSNCDNLDCSYLNIKDTIKLCLFSDTINIQLENYYNLDSVNYDIYSNGILLLANQTSIVHDGLFSFLLPSGINGNNINLYINGPNLDSSFVIFDSYNIDFGDYIQDTICNHDQPFTLPIAIPLGGTYSGVGVIGNQLDPLNANLGLNTITYSISSGVNSCLFQDSIYFFVENCLGIIDETNTSLSVSPNPFIKEFKIHNDKNLNGIVIVNDFLGRIVFEAKLDSDTIINLENYTSGIYLLVIENNDNILFRENIIKQ